MTAQHDVYRKAGEALELAQMLEEALTIPLLMLAIIDSVHASECCPDEAEL